MSYSRWLGSYWYTFWSATESKKRDDQVFSVDCQWSFTYKQLKDDMAECVKKIKDQINAEGRKVLPDDTEYDELILYMKRFLRDVKKDKDIN